MDLLVAGPECDCEETRPFIEQFRNLRLLQFLVNLNESYSHVRSQVLLKIPVLTVNQAYALVIQEESQRTLGVGESNNDALTMLAGKNQTLNQGFKAIGLICEFCGYKGHLKENYYKIIGYLPDFKSKKKVPIQGVKTYDNADTTEKGNASSPQSTQGTFFTEDQYKQLLNLLNKQNTGDCQSLMAGASHHITFHKEIMHDVKDCNAHNNIGVQVPTGNKCQITHTGNVSILDNQVLKDVLHVLDFKFNLLSVPKLTKELCCIAMFFPDFYIPEGLYNGKVMGIGKESCGLYLLQRRLMPAAKMVTNDANNSVLWHIRLGHPSINAMQHIQQLKNSVDSRVQHSCGICPLAKQSRLKFTSSSNNIVSSFQLVHVDVWGSYRIPTHDRKHYSITVVDNYSRVTWICLLQSKSEVMVVLKNFFLMVKNKFGVTVKTLRSDNGTEFFNSNCNELFFFIRNCSSEDVSFREDMFPFKNSKVDYVDLFPKQPKLVVQSAQPSIEQEPTSSLIDNGTQEQMTYTEDLTKTHEDHIDTVPRETFPIDADTSQANLDETPIPSQPSEPSPILSYQSYLRAFSACIEPNSFNEAVQDDRWIEAMNQEIQALEDNMTWELIELPKGKQGDLYEEVYMSSPQEFTKQGETKLIRKLLYLTITRPDISFAVQSLSQFMQRPKQSHLEAAFRVVRYLKGCPGLGVLLPADPLTNLTAYCDSNLASCPNTRRPVTGYVIKLGEGLIFRSPRNKHC
ncbi:uncharacterized protein [Nicotiana sylvestris]|uniref:uncharacterized protein n=1 Tax=Nicotiana sylvestris TaxID=4096 RepID=UPI00388C6B38